MDDPAPESNPKKNLFEKLAVFVIIYMFQTCLMQLLCKSYVIICYNSVKNSLKTREAYFLPVLLGHQQRMFDRFLVPLELMGQIPA